MATVTETMEQIQPAPVPHSKYNLVASLTEWRRSLRLPSPGPFEQLHREVRGVFVTNALFDGAKFDFGKMLSPTFQVQHNFALGSQVMPPVYSFGAVYATDALFLNGSIDHEGNLMARANYNLTRRLTAKFQSQVGQQPEAAMAQLEADYSGSDFSANVKAVNASPTAQTGIFVASYLQSVSKKLALGVEHAYQHPTPEVAESQTSLVAKYTGSNFVLTTNLAQIGVLQATYHHRLSETVELGAELQVMATQEQRRDAICTLGGKWDFRQSTFRGQLDTSGRVCAILEQKLAPGLSVLFTGDIDHMKGQSKFGLGLQLEN